MDPIFRSEALRRYSFSTWPQCGVTGSSLAKAGFYYIQEKDYVKCFHCGIILGNWSSEDPVLTHLKHNRQCEFMRGWPCGNFQIKEYLFPTNPPRVWMRTLSLTYLCPKTFRKAPAETMETEIAFSQWYADCARRLRTFNERDWSGLTNATTMAEAGFYFTGIKDNTICFQCNLGLRDWQLSDNPWEQHAIWSKRCKFLIQTKGENFINEAIRENYLKNRQE